MANENILLWAIGGGFAGTWTMMFFMFKKIDHRIDKLEEKITKLDERLSKVETRLTVIETILHMKECCMIKDDRKLTKAE